MDEYGCIDLEKDDLREILWAIDNSGSALFSYSNDSRTAYIVLIVGSFKKLGVLPWGGKPDGAWLVSLKNHGGLFYWDPEIEAHPSYVGEKLSLGYADAQAITTLLNCLSEEYRDDEG